MANVHMLRLLIVSVLGLKAWHTTDTRMADLENITWPVGLGFLRELMAAALRIKKRHPPSR